MQSDRQHRQLWSTGSAVSCGGVHFAAALTTSAGGSAKGTEARHQTVYGVASSLGGTLNTGPVLRELTTIHQPCREIGETALRIMLERPDRPKAPARDVLLDCHLVVRESCGGATKQ